MAVRTKTKKKKLRLKKPKNQRAKGKKVTSLYQRVATKAKKKTLRSKNRPGWSSASKRKVKSKRFPKHIIKLKKPHWAIVKFDPDRKRWLFQKRHSPSPDRHAMTRIANAYDYETISIRVVCFRNALPSSSLIKEEQLIQENGLWVFHKRPMLVIKDKQIPLVNKKQTTSKTISHINNGQSNLPMIDNKQGNSKTYPYWGVYREKVNGNHWVRQKMFREYGAAFLYTEM